MRIITRLLLIGLVLGVCFSNTDHLVLNRITIKPTDAEFVSIYNPTNEEINLSNYYITDSNIDENLYYNLPTGENYWSSSSSQIFTDFIARFPDITISANDSLILSFQDDNSFFDYYNTMPDLSLFEDMIDLDDGGTISCTSIDGCSAGTMNILSDDEEVLILFYWDGSSTTVKDVDYFLWGGNDHAIDKTGIGDYLDDTIIDNQSFQNAHEDSYTYRRIDLDEGNETQQDSGNGITGDDETSEDITSTWEITSSPEFGCTDESASNYDSNATIDDGSCLEPSSSISDIINNCADELGESIQCDGEYDLSSESAAQCPLYEQQITTTGVVVDYFDITPFNGPYSFTIQDIATGDQMDFVVWPESSDFQDGFNITQTDLNVLTQQPFGRYEVQITGDLGAYCDDDQLLDINSEWQTTVEYEFNVTILQEFNPDDFGCTDPEAHNYNPDSIFNDGSCSYPIETTIIDVINNCGDEMGSLIECDGAYDLSPDTAASCAYYDSLVTVSGLLVDYFDVTAFGGPHSFTLSDEDGYRIEFSIWPSSNEYQDGFDITLTDLNKLRFSPFGNYFLEITGTVSAYCDDDMVLDIYNEWQITVEHIEDLVVIEEIGGYFVEDPLINKVQIAPEPYVLIPSLGETLDFTYSHPENSRVTIRIFDLSGRFITSLVDKYVEESGIWYNGVNPIDPDDSDTWENSNSSAWDGRDHLGQIVSPGTYIIHIESYDFSTGKSSSDMAPIVIGVGQ